MSRHVRQLIWHSDEAAIRSLSKMVRNIAYFGGKAKQVERNTRVKARVKAHALHEIIESRENVIIMGHSLTDVDSLGAGIGMCSVQPVCLEKRHRS